MNRKRLRLRILHAYSTNDALSNDSKVNDLVALTVTFTLKIAFTDICFGVCLVISLHKLVGFRDPFLIHWTIFRTTALGKMELQVCGHKVGAVPDMQYFVEHIDGPDNADQQIMLLIIEVSNGLIYILI